MRGLYTPDMPEEWEKGKPPSPPMPPPPPKQTRFSANETCDCCEQWKYFKFKFTAVRTAAHSRLTHVG